ncbi:MAG TPA: ABC transporter substrate-binding protein [Solirubrobacterales bacterium]|nr:ABC transporter substrate-binding protein [Solirubrobacterales bacterium]
MRNEVGPRDRLARLATAALLLLVAALALAACGGSSSGSSSSSTTGAAASETETAASESTAEAPSGAPVKMGVILPLSGAIAAAGKEGLQAIELAAEEVNAEGGIDGQPLEVIAEDSQGEVQPALEAASKLVNIDKVPVTFGEYGSSVSLPVGQYLTKHKVLFITPSSAPELRDMGPLEFGIAALDTVTAKLAAEDLQEKGLEKIAVLAPNNSYGRYIAKGLESTMKELGGSVSSSVLYQEGQSDYRTELNRMAESEPDAYVYASYGADAATINKDAYEMGLSETPWYGIYLSADIAEADPVSTNGQIGIDQAIAGAEGKKFTANYEKKFGEEPTAPFDAYAYDAVKTYAEAVEIAGTTEPTAVAKALEGIEHEGATGLVTFDSDGQRATVAFALVEAQNGETKTVKIINGES